VAALDAAAADVAPALAVVAVLPVVELLVAAPPAVVELQVVVAVPKGAVVVDAAAGFRPLDRRAAVAS
jgi:hypothetical protein